LMDEVEQCPTTPLSFTDTHAVNAWRIRNMGSADVPIQRTHPLLARVRQLFFVFRLFTIALLIVPPTLFGHGPCVDPLVC